MVAGAREPTARLRPRCRRTVSPSSRYKRCVFLAVDRQAVAAEQDGQSPVAEPTALGCQLAQARTHRGIVAASRAVSDARPVRADDRARPPLAHPQAVPEMRDRLAPGGRRYHFFASRSFSPALSSIASASSRFSNRFSS